LNARADEYRRALTIINLFNGNAHSCCFVNKDKRGADQQKLVKETADKVSAHLAKMKAPAGKEAQFKELQETWAAFKKTRETELVPAVLAGKEDDAKKLVNGIQKERYTKCQQILADIGS
jgi:hypothetical protein